MAESRPQVHSTGWTGAWCRKPPTELRAGVWAAVEQDPEGECPGWGEGGDSEALRADLGAQWGGPLTRERGCNGGGSSESRPIPCRPGLPAAVGSEGLGGRTQWGPPGPEKRGQGD